MTVFAFDDSDWSRALTLAERATLFRASSPGPSSASAQTGPEEERRAAYRLECWKSQAPFAEGGWLARRLAPDGLDLSSLARLLRVAPVHLLAADAPIPDWVTRLRECTSSPEWPGAESLPLPTDIREDPLAGFLNLVAPLLRRGLDRLREGISGIISDGSASLFDPAEAERILLAPLSSNLLGMLDRTLALELNVARIEGRLTGETSEERFASFVEGLRRREPALAILKEYPVLARLVVEAVERWVGTSLELLRRLGGDFPAIRSAIFEGKDPGRLTAVLSGAGDTHLGGRSVAILRFEGGRKLVYKPRPLAVDVHFQELLKWLNRLGEHPSFRLLKILDRGSHGWIEFVSAEPCASKEEVARYHVRLGGLLAVLHAIGAVDFHFDNLIAAGDQPVPVDLESLFHPRIPRPESERPDERLAGRVLSESVLRVGLLPFRVGESEGFAGSDLSGVASVAGSPTPDRQLHWERTGSDEMIAVRKRLTLGGGKNRPVLDGKEADVADHIPEFVEGFQALYRLLVGRKEELLAPGGPLASFAEDPVRAVLRSTRAYGLILEESFHPDFLRDALDRDRFLDRLWVGVEELPALEQFVRFEQRDLWGGDIPCFGAIPDSVALFHGTEEPVRAFFPERSRAEARCRVERMGEEDLFRQSWLTRISLGTLLLNRSKGDWPGFPLRNGGEAKSEDEVRSGLLRAARGIGEWFHRMAVRDRDHLTWVGLDLRNQIWSLYPMPEDLYAGTPGIALFLAYLSEITGEGRFGEMARCGMRTLLARLRRVADQVPNVGMFQGWGGAIYSLAHLGALWRDGEWISEAEEITEKIAERIEKDTYLDVVAGSAGAIGALLALHRAGGSPRSLEVAVKCGERLVGAAKGVGSGLAWLTEIGGDEPQTGFSHGAAGIALALAELSSATGEHRPRAVALGGFTFERESAGNEPPPGLPGRRDGRSSDKMSAAEKSLAMSWCYGAPGVGLACLRAYPILEESLLLEDSRRCVAMTLERGFGKNHSLCHGDLGNLDLILQAHHALGEPSLLEAFRRLTRSILASVETDGWICGTVANIEAPGLMNGLAGIGLGLLRAAEPGRVPSVLVMDGPPGGRHR